MVDSSVAEKVETKATKWVARMVACWAALRADLKVVRSAGPKAASLVAPMVAQKARQTAVRMVEPKAECWASH